MKIIKSFDKFLNEELSPSTYRSAADKLRAKGHDKRARRLMDHTLSHKPKLDTVTITIDGLDYDLNHENIIIYNDTPTNININIFGDSRLINPETAWEISEIRNSFMNEYGYSDETGTDFENFDDLNNRAIDDFNDYINEIQPFILNIDFNLNDKEIASDKPGMTTIEHTWESDISGTIIENRKNAVKVLKLLKDFANNYGGEIKDAINTLTVNDLYQD